MLPTSAIFAYAMRWMLLHHLPLPYPGVPGKVVAAAENAARHYDVPAALILAVAKVESHFDPRAVSRAGALGIMQIMPGTARMLHIRDVFSIKESMNGAARYLSGFITRFGLRQAVFAYNTGHAGTPWQVNHSGYVQAVWHDYQQIRMAS